MPGKPHFAWKTRSGGGSSYCDVIPKEVRGPGGVDPKDLWAKRLGSPVFHTGPVDEYLLVGRS